MYSCPSVEVSGWQLAFSATTSILNSVSLLIMMTLSNGNISALLVLCAGNSAVTGEFPSQRLLSRSFHLFFDPRLNKRLSKQSRRRRLETLSRSLCVTLIMYRKSFASFLNESTRYVNRIHPETPAIPPSLFLVLFFCPTTKIMKKLCLLIQPLEQGT